MGHGLVALGIGALGAPVVRDPGLRGKSGAREADQPPGAEGLGYPKPLIRLGDPKP